MEREIKFRFWIFNKKEMVYQGNTIDENRTIFWKKWETTSHVSNPMQFTGSLDKNKKEIYIGDINQDGGKVIWNKDCAAILWSYPNGDMHEFENEANWCEIIGNIYANPELLTSKTTTL